MADMDEYYLDLGVKALIEAKQKVDLALVYLSRSGAIGEYDEKKFKTIKNALIQRVEVYTSYLAVLEVEG